MTRATKVKKARQEAARAKPEERLPRGLIFLAAAGVAAMVAAGALLLWSSSRSESEQTFTGVPFEDPGPVHVHGLGIDPADGALFIATHTGLFRVAEGSRKAVRVGDRYQDTMGFSVIGPSRFIGSGHPDVRDRDLPPLLGLIESTDAGKTWTPVSLLGEADFHVLRSAGRRVYGYDATNGRLLASADGGREWKELPRPAPLVDLAPDPGDPQRLVATGEGGLYASRDGGESWQRLDPIVALLAWPAPKRLYLLDGSGAVFVSADGGGNLTRRGEIGGEPAALLAVEDELYAALHDGTIKRSTDGGATWAVRSSP
ncbi:MAG: hypothetical protein WEB90_08125 [Gemmatimonadota bacterium]